MTLLLQGEMAGASMASVPEALLTVAEKTLDSQPLFLGLSASQLSRIAREVYVYLKKSGKEALAEQAQVLTDPNVIAKALQQLQQQPQLQQQEGPSTVAACPCCTHRNACCGAQGAMPQPQVVPIVLQQPPPQWPIHQQLQPQHYVPPPQQPQYIKPHQQQEPEQRQLPQGQQEPATPLQLPAECPQQQQPLQLEQSQQHGQLQPLQEQHMPQEQQQQQQTSRKACVARLLFAVIAAKIARDGLIHLRRSSNSRRLRKAVRGSPVSSGMGSVSVEGLAEALGPRRGLFAGLQEDLLLSLQRIVSAAIDGATAALGAAGYGPPKEGPQAGLQELPPLYLAPAQQGRVELTPHEKYATEIIERLLKMEGGRSPESLRLDAEKETEGRHQRQQQQQQRQHEHQQEKQTMEDGTVAQQQQATNAITDRINEADAVDAEFKVSLRRKA